jgi:hypothetical protein
MVNGEKVLIVTLYLSNNTPIDDCSHLGTFTPKFSEEYSIVPEEGVNTMPIILAGDFNIDLKKKNETFIAYRFLINGDTYSQIKDFFFTDTPYIYSCCINASHILKYLTHLISQVAQ